MQRLLPCYPLWIIDPLFSVWSKTDNLNGGDTIFWTGRERRAYGFLRYEGKTYSFLGRRDGAEPLRQTRVEVTAFSTDYTFESEKFDLKVRFLSPLLPDDLQAMSCPVCYTEYEVSPKGKLPEDFSVALALDEEFCYDRERADVIGGVLPCKGYEAAFFTRRRNLVLSDTSDAVAPDWGSTYLAGEESFYFTDTALNRYVYEGEAEYMRKADERSYIFSRSKKRKGLFLTAFDDFVSIFYFGEWLKGYFFRNGETIVDAMDFSFENHERLNKQCERFDRKLKEDCARVGEGYYLLACASLRQSVGAHKLVQNKKGELLFLSKECRSNGCIGTVDISYPASPLYLLYAPELVNAMLNGIFEFARKPVWTFDFAPHDLGTYPWCCGQVYSVEWKEDKFSCGQNWVPGEPGTRQMLYLRPAASNVYTARDQMPVEECGNMLIMAAAALAAGAAADSAAQNFDLLTLWVQYLERYGLRPEDQLCTDDFAGHLANNVNLAVKALVGIEADSLICGFLGKKELSAEYLQKAERFAEELKSVAGDGVWPLAYGSKNTYSLKYNILFDKLFGFSLIGQDICEREVAHYIEKQNRFGTPLDSRENYTKSDWLLWAAALSDDGEKVKAMYMPVVRYLSETPSRVPFSDWYRTEKGEIVSFINRAVQGGIFAPLLKQSGKLCRRALLRNI